MGQIKIYGVKEMLNLIKDRLSTVIHWCMVKALEFPSDKEFRRSFPIEKKIFILQVKT